MIGLKLIRLVRLGLKSLMLHKLRSMLTMLGVVFGVASVIAMLSIGEGASYEVQQQIKELGSSNVIIQSVKPTQQTTAVSTRNRAVEYGISYVDADSLAATIPGVVKLVPIRDIRQDVLYLDRRADARVIGTLPDYPDVANFHTQRGRFVTDLDVERTANVCVLGQGLATDLFRTDDPIGKDVKISSNYFRVVGIMESRSSKKGGASTGTDLNYYAYIPLSTARKWFGETLVKVTSGTVEMERVELHGVILQLAQPSEVIPAAGVVRNLLDRNHKQQDYELVIPLELLQQAERTKRIFNVVLGAIAGISLLVGGIGIMNIMLASVTERTREIGVRRALGAKRRHIVAQFLIETLVLASVGGVLGILLGVSIPYVVSHTAGLPTIVTPWAILIAIGISSLVGLVFGIYPAWQAAQLDPIQALRHE